jgi:hypothetical protein
MNRLVLVAILFAAPFADAGETRHFRQSNHEEFAQGEATGTMVLPSGEVVAGMTRERFSVDAAFVWCATLSGDGKTAYLGTGDTGKVFAVTIGEKKSTPRLLATLPEPWVTAITTTGDGALLAATTPGARIYRIDPKSGKFAVVATLDTNHIWALVHDVKKRTTFAATGGPGKIVALEPGAGDALKPRVLWDSKDTHIVSLVAGGASLLLAGTSETAVLYAVNYDGKATALHDFEASEVRSIAAVGDALYVAVNAFTASGGTATEDVGRATGTKIQVVTGGKVPSAAGALPRPGAPKGTGAVYRLEKDGSIEQVHSLADGYFTAVLSGGKSSVFAATGSDGKVFRISSEREVGLAVDLDERQSLTLLPHGDGLLVGTGDGAALISVRPSPPIDARYLSKIFDAARPAQWGQAMYGASIALELETRSGNTARPDGNWDAWKPLGASQFIKEQDRGTGQVASAPGRYLQYRVKVAGDASLRDMDLAYLPQNQRARVTELTIEAESATEPKPTHTAILKLRWKVSNPDEDALIYKLAYRQTSEQVWRPLGPEEPLQKPEFDWDTDSVPDGRYLVRVWSSDGNAAAQNRALSHEYISPPLLVDNTRPVFSALSEKLPVISGKVTDTSGIEQVEFAINGGAWRPVSCDDGIFDEPSEGFSFRPPVLPSGTHIISVRARDEAHNLGVTRLVVRVK